MDSKLRIALVGCGGIMDLHLKGYVELLTHDMDVFEIVATCDMKEELAEEKSRKIAVFQNFKPRVYVDLEKMLENESLDAVDLALPHDLHHTVASRCLEEGLHVIIEKPLGITMRAAKMIIDKAEKSNRVLAVAENYRRSAENRVIMWAIRHGLIGEPRIVVWILNHANTRPWGWRVDKYRTGGSWVFDGGVHIADLDRYQLGKEALDVYAIQDTFETVRNGIRVTVDDMTMGIIRYEGRIYAQWLWTAAAPGRGLGLRNIYGSRGSINTEEAEVQREEGSREVFSMNTLINKMLNEIDQKTKEKWFPSDIIPRGAMDIRTFAIELFDFYDSIIGKRKPEVDGLEAYKDMAICIGLYESAVLGKPISVRDIERLSVEEYQGEINEKLKI